MQKVVNRRKDREEVYIGRGSKWGNPFKVGEHGAKGECVQLFTEWICRGEGRYLLNQLGELEGKTLGCYCAPKGGTDHTHRPWVCHGQVLLALLQHRRAKLSRRAAA
ncbi:MAG: hypothetical protein AVDCRST_MAG93-7206 [uncultured Chloroflexia bacterium]|uniref:DUF4326 domain-containing protein n=1 Tax=uncultured Chloroflexia bacterium TaxID=1672391 RepID=A0A6J4M9T1_9CHLR|nr:MAG: hypothetical protein AVDCRST_MAG93-7206 [uncultured Chloroflexia bacterium]